MQLPAIPVVQCELSNYMINFLFKKLFPLIYSRGNSFFPYIIIIHFICKVTLIAGIWLKRVLATYVHWRFSKSPLAELKILLSCAVMTLKLWKHQHASATIQNKTVPLYMSINYIYSSLKAFNILILLVICLQSLAPLKSQIL